MYMETGVFSSVKLATCKSDSRIVASNDHVHMLYDEAASNFLIRRGTSLHFITGRALRQLDVSIWLRHYLWIKALSGVRVTHYEMRVLSTEMEYMIKVCPTMDTLSKIILCLFP